MLKLCFDKKQTETLHEGLSIISKTRGFEFGETGDISVSLKRTASGLSIEGKDGSYIISYSEKSDFFRAVSMLVGMLESSWEKWHLPV